MVLSLINQPLGNPHIATRCTLCTFYTVHGPQNGHDAHGWKVVVPRLARIAALFVRDIQILSDLPLKACSEHSTWSRYRFMIFMTLGSPLQQIAILTIYNILFRIFLMTQGWGFHAAECGNYFWGTGWPMLDLTGSRVLQVQTGKLHCGSLTGKNAGSFGFWKTCEGLPVRDFDSFKVRAMFQSEIPSEMVRKIRQGERDHERNRWPSEVLAFGGSHRHLHRRRKRECVMCEISDE